jgi:cytidylate kinase
VAPLRPAEDAEIVDTTGLTLDEVLELLVASVRKKTGAGDL